MATTIRRAKTDDAKAVGDVFLAARATMTYLPRLHTDEETRAHFANVVRDSQDVWVAEREGRVTGFAVVHDKMLHHLYVHPTRFNTGTGTKLFREACATHPEGFQFWAFQKNTGARRFYERHGCALVKLTDGQENEEKEPDALYIWPAP
jgi:L-amino acid N-acyltransferase YncA